MEYDVKGSVIQNPINLIIIFPQSAFFLRDQHEPFMTIRTLYVTQKDVEMWKRMISQVTSTNSFTELTDPYSHLSKTRTNQNSFKVDKEHLIPQLPDFADDPAT
nr:unnamed protein product [Callosobruchus chinensis]